MDCVFLPQRVQSNANRYFITNNDGEGERKQTFSQRERERERETISTYIEGKEKEKQHSSTGATVSLCKQRAIAAVNLARALSTGLIYFLYRTTTAAAAGGTATGRYVYILLIIVMLWPPHWLLFLFLFVSPCSAAECTRLNKRRERERVSSLELKWLPE